MADSVFPAPAPRFFSIAPGRPFLKSLAEGLTASFAEAGFSPADATIYLPTRRAARALGEAFLAASGKSAALTPRIRALGDIDEDALSLADDVSASIEDEFDISPAIASARRRLVLARFIAEKEKTFFNGQRHWAGAIAAADELGRLLDSLYTEEIDPARLKSIVPETLAKHWQASLDFLEIVTGAWPALLKAEGASDPAARRIALIDAQTKRWEKHPPKKPVIVAGTTGSTPAVARMMRAVAQFEFGCVVLPGLDLDASDHVWNAIDDPHPQSGMKALLKALGVSRGGVRPWSGDGASPRAALMTMALRPAAASDDWLGWTETAKAAGADIVAGLDGLSLIEARDEEAEASIIALSFRDTLETPDKTAMLVTPDRDLARRVAMKMRRWGVTIDDSAGAPFANTRCGGFLRLTAAWLGEPSNPVKLMAMADHPLFAGGFDGSERVTVIGRLDRALRGLRPAPGLDGLRAKLADTTAKHDDLARLMNALADAAQRWPGNDAPFAERFEAHLAASEIVAASASADGAERLWRDEDGGEGALLLASLREHLPLIVHDRGEEYAAIFTRLIAGAAVRRRAPAHPRLTILGPLEARLQSADKVILGGLNEGVWPRDAAVDPFLSRPMREKLGLPSPERRIGLAAHDFAQLAAAPEVVLTRASRAGGKPSKPSRWIVRLRNILEGANLLARVENSAPASALVDLLDRADLLPAILPPRPQPPVAARPTHFSVTEIETLLRDPYAIYAKKVLKIGRLDPLDEEFSARQLGIFLHAVLEDYARSDLPGGANERKALFAALFDKHACASGLEPRHEPFWRARAMEAFDGFDEWSEARRRAGTVAVTEGKGDYAFAADGASFSLRARADRIDREQDGSAYIADYKTGTLPTLKQAKAGFSPQLPLTGVIVEAGGFEALGPARVSGFDYVRVIGGTSDKGKNIAGAEGDDAAKLIAAARDGIEGLMRHFMNAEAVYPSQPRPQYQSRFGEYDHLARRRERNAQGGDDGEGGE
ncbi:MAG: double-strand break repair protein AddB [Parvularculaceae bacterium]